MNTNRTNDVTQQEKHARDIAWRSVCEARKLLGNGWSHVSDEIRWGLVCANILGVIAGQDALSFNAQVERRAAVADYAMCLWRAANEIRDNDWARVVRLRKNSEERT